MYIKALVKTPVDQPVVSRVNEHIFSVALAMPWLMYDWLEALACTVNFLGVNPTPVYDTLPDALFIARVADIIFVRMLETKAVVATCVVFVPAAAVEALNVCAADPANNALASNAVCNPDVLAIDKAASAMAVALPVDVTGPVKLAFVVTVAALPGILV